MTEYIDRKAVQEMIENAKHIVSAFGPYCGYCMDDIDLSSIPAADVAPVVHGKWAKEPVYRRDLHGKMIHFCTKYICSACNHESNTLSSGRFCPNCGAKMDLENE